MKSIRRRPKLLLLLFGLAAGPRLFAALTATEWAHRQSIEVAAPGLVRVALPAGTFDDAQPSLADLRLTAPSGQEVPYFLDRDFSERGEITLERPRSVQPAAFRAEQANGLTQLVIATGTAALLDTIELQTSAPYFLKAAHIEISPDGEKWESIGPAYPVFRQFGAELLQLPLGQPAAHIRITIDDARSRPIAISGVRLWRPPENAAPPTLTRVATKVERTDEFAGETVLTVGLPGRRIPLGEIHLEIKDPLFMRRVTVAVREVRGGIPGERVIGAGTLYRVALDGSPARVLLDVPVDFPPPVREVLVHIHNADSPPLTIVAVEARQKRIHLLFMAPAAGTYFLLSGNPQAPAPRYDLAVFGGEMRAAGAAEAKAGEVEAMPSYQPKESLAGGALADVPLTGAPLDTRAWSMQRPVQVTRVGVQELELDPEALARSRSDFSDLRLLREGNQIPYVLEQPALSRSLPIAPVSEPDPKRPTVSRWRITLPNAGLPARRVALISTTPLFQRDFRLYEKSTGSDGRAFEITFAAGDWSRTPEPGVSETRIFELAERPRTNTIWLETDNGDNPPITLGTVQVIYPVVRLIFKVQSTDALALAYGNREVNAPRYDLSLVAVKLLTSSRSPATMSAGQAKDDSTRRFFEGLSGGPVFWGALAVVVIVLLVVVARLLPKPPAA